MNEEQNIIDLNQKLFDTIFVHKYTGSYASDLQAIENLIASGANVNYVDYYDKYREYTESLLSMVIYILNFVDNDEDIKYYYNVAKLLLFYGADISLFGKCDYQSHLNKKCNDDRCKVCQKLTALDLLILQMDNYGIDDTIYLLFSMMVSSLSDKELINYLQHYRKSKTINILRLILQEFDRYESIEKTHPEYLI